jgi:hypothetical protein
MMKMLNKLKEVLFSSIETYKNFLLPLIGMVVIIWGVLFGGLYIIHVLISGV